MTNSFIVAAASIKLTPLDFEGNRERICSVIDAEKKSENPSTASEKRLIVFPELCISGYGCEDAFFYEDVLENAQNSLEKLLAYTDENLSIIVGFPYRLENSLYNCAALISDKHIIGIVPKQNLANDGIHYERRWFTPYPRGKKETITLFKQEIPFGDYILDLHGKRIGLEICEDAWIEDRPAHCHIKAGVDIIANPSASHFAFGKYEIRQQLAISGSTIGRCVYIFANQLGNEAGRAIYDGDAIIADRGSLVSYSPRLTLCDYNICRYQLPVDVNVAPISITPPADKTEIFYDVTRAVALGLYDYLKKSGAKRFVLSLSGGADSAVVALMVRAVVFFGVKDRGFDDFKNSLGADFKDFSTELQIMKAFLLCVYQGTTQNSSTTYRAAQQVAHTVGSSFFNFSIDTEVRGFQEKIEIILERPLDWDRDNVALQNIQARVRSPGIWLLTNATDALLLTTGNRSELTVGYSTMDGDSSGSLAPVAGVSKSFIQRYLRWLQTNSVEGFGPFPELTCITDQLPTAELKPLAENQTDEKDLMPYVVLEYFEQSRLRDRKSAPEILNQAHQVFSPEYSADQLQEWYKKFEKLWRISQWKRERSAPGFHLDEFSVDSRAWLRYPILSGPI